MKTYLGKCDVCGKETDVQVAASTMGGISFAYCFDCLHKDLEPYGAMVAYIACAGRFPDEINEQYQQHVRYILEGLGVSEDRFIADVDKDIKEMNDQMNKWYEEDTYVRKSINRKESY